MTASSLNQADRVQFDQELASLLEVKVPPIRVRSSGELIGWL
jgi:hypothetical protein